MISSTIKTCLPSIGSSKSLIIFTLAAVAFIGREKDGVDRTKLPPMIAELVSNAELKPCGKNQTLFEYVKEQPKDPQVRENILNATIAIKLALKLFPVEKEGKEHAETQLETAE